MGVEQHIRRGHHTAVEQLFRQLRRYGGKPRRLFIVQYVRPDAGAAELQNNAGIHRQRDFTMDHSVSFRRRWAGGTATIIPPPAAVVKRTLPFTLWTDLRYKEPPSVEVTKGGISTDINRSINWNLSTCYAFSYHINTSQHFSD